MAKPPKTFDVWFVAANTVYKGVPYTVVADWVQEGRLAAADMVRPAGTSVAWAKVAGHEFLADYLPRPAAAKVVPATPAAGFEVVEEPAAGAAVPAPAELPEPEPPHRPVSLGDEDDEVDMIPLIDISMVLLVFFIMMRAAGALAPIDVPEMRYAGELAGDPEAITIEIDKADEFNVAYSVRRGNTAPRSGHGKLPTPEAAVAALDELLDELLRNRRPPPEVRIACRKDLPNDRVTEIQDELEKRLRKNYINSYVATVIEAQKK